MNGGGAISTCIEFPSSLCISLTLSSLIYKKKRIIIIQFFNYFVRHEYHMKMTAREEEKKKKIKEQEKTKISFGVYFFFKKGTHTIDV